MTERSFGESVQTWIGVVTSVMDPHQSGRVQVRVFGKHDDKANIPDEDLPWAQVLQPVTSAARGRMGTAPVGLVVGSRVFGQWLDRDHQYPLVQGSVGRAGAPIAGQTDGGAPAIDTSVGSIPPATQGQASNPYTDLNSSRVSIADVDSGETDIDNVKKDEGVVLTSAVEEGMSFADVPTTASGEDGETNVLDLLRSVDPRSTLSALPCLPSNALTLRINIDLGSMAAGFINTLTDAMVSAIMRAIDRLGIDQVLSAIDSAASAIANYAAAIEALATGGICAAPAALNSIEAGTHSLARSVDSVKKAAAKVGSAPSAIKSELGYTLDSIGSSVATSAFIPAALVELSAVPVGYVQDYYPVTNDPYPGYIRWYDQTGMGGDPVFTPRNGQPNFTSARQHSSYETAQFMAPRLAGLISAGGLNSGSLQGLLSQTTSLAQASGLQRSAGASSPASLLSLGASLAPALFSNVDGVFNVNISLSTLPAADLINSAVSRFTRVQADLAARRAKLESAFRRL